jgi:hypothetical protein
MVRQGQFGSMVRAAAVGSTCGRFLILLLALLLPLRAHASIGAAEAVVNHVAAHMPGQDRALRAEDEVFQDEVIETGAKSASKLLFRDATQIRIGPNSKVVLDKFVYSEKSGQEVVVSMAVGVMRFTSGKLIKSAYLIRTPTATVGIRGTEFDVIVDENGATTIVVYSGEVLMRSTDGTNTSIGVCGLGMTSSQGETLTTQPQQANELAPEQMARVLEMDQLLQSGVQTVAAGVGDCLEPAGPGGAPGGEQSPAPTPFPTLPNLVRVNAQQQNQPALPMAPQPWAGSTGFASSFAPRNNAQAPTTPSLPSIPVGGGSGVPGAGGPGSGNPGNGNPGSGNPGNGDPGAGDPGDPGGGDPGTGGPAGPRIAYSGLAFDNQPNPSQFGFTQLNVGGGAPSHTLAPIAGPAQAPVGQLSYDLVLANGGAVNAVGGLDGAQLEFNASTVDFVSSAGGGPAQLTITGGLLTLSYVDDAFDYAEVDLPFGFGVADPTYALDGRIEFTLLDEQGTLVSGYWEILGTDRETGLPYNALSVGTDRDGGAFDLAFFLRSASGLLECGGCSYEGMQIGLLFAGWGAPVTAPGAAWALCLAGLWLVRRRAAA